MPYIKPAIRTKIDTLMGPLLSFVAEDLDAGNVNYIITRILQEIGASTYDDFNGLIGVLECAKLELYRRAVAPYEDTKIASNGDVY